MRFRRPISIRSFVLFSVAGILLLTVGAIVGVQFLYIRQAVDEGVRDRFEETASKIALHIADRNRMVETLLDELTYDTHFIEPLAAFPEKMVRRLLYTMRRYPRLYAIDYADAEGNFLQVIDVGFHKEAAAYYRAPAKVRWVVVRLFHQGNGQKEVIDYLDEKGRPVASRAGKGLYDPSGTRWFAEALKSGKIYRSALYRFAHFPDYGVTYAKRFNDREVLAFDLTYGDLKHFFQSQLAAPEARITLFDTRNDVVVTTASFALARHVAASLANIPAKTVTDVTWEGQKYLAMKLPLSARIIPDSYLAFTIPLSVMRAPYMREVYMSLAMATGVLLLLLLLFYRMVDLLVRPIGKLMEENEKIRLRHYKEVRPLRSRIREIEALSESLLSLAASVEKHEKSLKEMISSFVRIIAEAIDKKSRYTGGHCERVPQIALMLAREANRCERGSLASFHFEEEDFRAFEMAAWLHDCGKITTPEFVVDKGSRLECVYNRIHEIRTRFEVLWRDAQIAFYKGLLAKEEPETLRRRLEEEKKWLNEAFEFVARCNLGEEFMDDHKRARLKEIAARKWVRHFDDRAGLSEAEQIHLKDIPAKTLPVEEPLLSDRPEHLYPREDLDLSWYRREGFRVEIPTWLYNRGEIYNLSVARGTLTKEERFKIEEHVMMTISMLEKIPYPPGYEKIPEYAGTHHETPSGEGYPRALRGEAFTLPGRIMAIADIFEALTAADRPYKEPKTLSQALTIMAYMVREKRLDEEIFALFVTSDIWLEYGRKHLRSDQIDTVDRDQILKTARGE